MAVEERLFLGIKQVTKETFSALDDSEKVGYLWFVRNEDPEHLEIYLGTRMYGETNDDDEYIDEIAQKIASAVGLTSGLTLPDGFEYESVIAAFDGKQNVIDDLDEIRSGATLGATAIQEESDPTVPAWAKEPNKPTYTAEEVGALPSSTTIPTKTSELINDSGYITGYTLPIASTSGLGGVKIGNGLEIDSTGVVNVVGKQDVLTAGNNIEITSAGTISATNTTYAASDFDIKDLSDTTGLRGAWSNKQDTIDDLDTIRNGATLGATALQSFIETDPTVPAWAKEPNKPTYTAEEVGALPSSTTIPTKTSELINDSGFVTGATTYSAGTNIEITGTGNSINALGYVYDTTKSSFATGLNTTASGNYSHAEGYGSTKYHNIASGDGSHAEGVCTRSQNKSEHAEGSANVSHKASNTYGDAGNTQHSIGIGTHYNSTKNAVEVMQNGDYYLIGVGGYQGTDTKVQNATIKTLQEVISGKQDTLTAGEGIEISGNTISATPTDDATNDDIDSMFVTEIKLIREQANDANYIDCLVNTNGETMEYNGQTYYKWVSWANDGYNNGSWTIKEHPNIIVLTNTLNVQLPFNTNSPEFEYWIDIDGATDNNYIHGDYTQKTFQ